MAKIDVDKVAEILKRNSIEPAKLRSIIEELRRATEGGDDGEPKPPPVKKQFVMLVSDPHGKIPKGDHVGWVLQIPENESPATITDRICRAAYDYNMSRRGRLIPAKTIGEAVESVGAKFLKQAGCWAKTREPVLIIRTDNRIPMDEEE